MNNEILYLLQTVVGLAFTLIAFRLGKHWLYGYIAVCIILANIFVTKEITLFGLTATGGNVVYGAIFLTTDILAEHYGKRAARRAVFIGFFVSLFYVVMSQFMAAFPINPNSENPEMAKTISEGMGAIFSFAPSIILASMTAYLVSQLHDIWAFHFIKMKTKGKLLWLRNNCSTWVSQMIDSVIFCLLAFLVFPKIMLGSEFVKELPVIIEIILSTYILKILVAVIDTPFIYLSYVVKPAE